MTQRFDEDGVSFNYPSGWQVEREAGETGWTVTLQSPGTAFVLMTLDREMPLVEEVANTALEALKSEYPGLDSAPCVDMLAGEMALGHDMQFFSLDLSNTCWTRCIYAEAGTLLVMCQVSDADSEEHEPALRAVCASVRVMEE